MENKENICEFCGAKLTDEKVCRDLYNELSYYSLTHPNKEYFVHQHVVDAYAAQHASKEASDEMLKLGAEILKEIKDLKEGKVLGDVQDNRKTKVLEIHNEALKRGKILSVEETLQIDQMGAF